MWKIPTPFKVEQAYVKMKFFNLHSHVEPTGINIQLDLYISWQHTVKHTTGNHCTIRGQVAGDLVGSRKLSDALYSPTNWKTIVDRCDYLH